MKPEKSIEEKIKKMHFEAGGQMHNKVLADVLKSHQEYKQKDSVTIKPSFRRKLMKNPITKFAAAAVIITAVLAGIYLFGGRINFTSVSWAEVVAQMNKYTRYKCRQRVVREKGLPEYPTMTIYHLNLSQRRQEAEDGTIQIIDMRTENPTVVELKPAQKKATVTKLIGFGQKEDPDIIAMVKGFEQVSTEKLGTKKVGGKILYGFRHKPNEYNDFTVWVDPDTKLPVEIELKHPNIGQTIFLDEFGFDFDLDESAFSTTVPGGYEVKTIIRDYKPFTPGEITTDDIRKGLGHTAYAIENLPWIEKVVMIQVVDPLSGEGREYLTGIKCDDGNRLVLVQGNYYEQDIMTWLASQQVIAETASGRKVVTHPNGSIYAQQFLECFAKVIPEFFDVANLSNERFTGMVVMPGGTVLGLSANKQLNGERLKELVESLIEIKPNE